MHRWIGRCAIVALLLLLGGCARNSVLMPYPFQAIGFKQAVGLAEDADSIPLLDATLLQLSEQESSDDKMLYLMERGRINQLASRYEESRKDFEQVIAGFESQDLSATLDVSELGNQGAALLLNDNIIPYSGAAYERIFTHLHQAFNYLGLRDKEGAGVEFRKAALEQDILRQQYDSELAKVEQKAQEQALDIEQASEQLSALKPLAKALKNSFQNAYTFYVSAAFWEAIGEYNNALVDYKKAREIRPEIAAIKRDIKRVEKKQNGRVRLSGKQGTVVVLFEDGFIPEKSAIQIALPTFDGGVISLAFPYYEPLNWPVSEKLRVLGKDFNELGTTEIVTDIGAMAVKDLQEQFPKQFLRQALRGMAKYRLQKKSREEFGLGGQFVANVYNLMTESADRRSWLTLPNTAQVMRFDMNEGNNVLKLSTPTLETSLQLDIKPNRTTLVRVVRANRRLLTQVYPL